MRELEPHGLGVEAMCRFEVTSGDSNVVESHVAILAPFRAVTLTPDSVDPDPIGQFRRWYDDAVAAGVAQPDAMTLATATGDGDVTARTVLMRGLDERGFTFFTNLASAKAAVLDVNPRAALVFHWREQERQVRVTGSVARVGTDEAVAYWNTRPLGHRLSAWASPQSTVVTEAELRARVAEVESEFAGTEPPLPPFWGGFRVAPAEVEFWQGRPDRLHDRVRYRREAPDRWVRERLAP
jgi:pyridoxamine 5'-phosphate oxidase